MIRPVLTLVLASICLLASMASADDVQRLYVLDCGRNLGRDQARWSPGVNEGQAIEFSDNCYLIRHAKGLLLWDTGVPDAVATMPDGMVVANGAITYRRAKTLAHTREPRGQVRPRKTLRQHQLDLGHARGPRRQHRAVWVIDGADPGRRVRLGDGGSQQAGLCRVTEIRAACR